MGAKESQITSLSIVNPPVFFGSKWKKTSRLRVTGLCAGNSPVTGDLSAQRASNTENVSIWWCHQEYFRERINSSSTQSMDFRSLQWRHNERDCVSNHQPHDYLFKCLFRHISKKTSKLRVTGLCEGNSPVTGELLAQRASNAQMFPFDDVIMWCILKTWYIHYKNIYTIKLRWSPERLVFTVRGDPYTRK